MQDILVGTGGWAYFPANEENKLKAYSKVFNFVETNCTFYEYPDPLKVERWRRLVPKDFTFSVRCHQDLTHRVGLKPKDEAYGVLDKMLVYCSILKAPFLVLETPSRYMFNGQTTKEARDFFASVNLSGVHLVWEIRSLLTAHLKNFMQEFNITHAVDLSREDPLFESDVMYARLFGKGNHNINQFVDGELQEIDKKNRLSKAKIVALSYHGVKMNTDAIRFVQYKKTGKFPSITGLTGVASAKTILTEDTRFPISRQALLTDQGWKVFDFSAERRMRLVEWLSRLPDRNYTSLKEIIDALKRVK